jgi:hypothetical protein
MLKSFKRTFAYGRSRLIQSFALGDRQLTQVYASIGGIASNHRHCGALVPLMVPATPPPRATGIQMWRNKR